MLIQIKTKKQKNSTTETEYSEQTLCLLDQSAKVDFTLVMVAAGTEVSSHVVLVFGM